MEPDIEVKIPKNASDVSGLFIEVLQAKFSIFVRVFKKFRIIMSILLICSIVSAIYLLFTDSSAGMSRVYAVIPIILLIIVYIILRTYITYRSQIDVTNQVLGKYSQVVVQAKPDSSWAKIDEKLFSRSNLNILTNITFFIVIAFIIYFIIYQFL